MNDHDKQNPDLATPERLRAALSRLNSRQVAVPPAVDDAILRHAREHLQGAGAVAAVPAEGSSRKPRQREAGHWLEEFRAGWMELFGGGRRAAVVAVTMIAAGVLVWLGGRTPLSAGREDLNGDGVVDMLDAFALARELQHNPASRPQLDFSGDGTVDGRDVRVLAARAVSLDQGGRS